MDKITFPEPDEVLKEKPSLKKYLKYLLFFGPGAVIASVTIGQGQLILGPQIGAWAGPRLLWLITINIASYIIAYISCRYTLITGLNVMDVFSTKLKGLINLIFIAIIVIFVPIFAGTIITSLGQVLSWSFGFGDYLIWGIIFGVFAAVLAVVGRYRLLEYTQLFFVIVLAVGAIISVALIPNLNLSEIIPHFFTIGDFPKYPEWVLEMGENTKPIPLLILGYVGTLTITIITLISYASWVKVKGWGIFKGKDDPEKLSRRLFSIFVKSGKVNYLPKDRKEIKKAKLLTTPILVDLALAFIFVSIASTAYMLAGAYLLGPRHEIPTDIDLIKKQAIIFSNIAPWLKPLYQISVFFAFFGTIYGGFEAASRMLYETSKNLFGFVAKLEYRKFLQYFLIYVIALGVPLAILMRFGLSVIVMLSITLLFIGVIGVIIYGIGTLYINYVTLPKEYRPGPVLFSLGIISIILLIVPFFSFIA